MRCNDLMHSIVKCKSLFFKLGLVYAPDVIDSYIAAFRIAEVMPDNESKTCVWELYYLCRAAHCGDSVTMFKHLDNIRNTYLSALHHLQANVNYHFELN